MNLTPERELTITAAVKAKIETVTGAVNVIAAEPFFDSKNDYIDGLTVPNIDGELETVFIKIDYLGWRDSLTDGCDDDPVVFVRYRIHAFHGYKEVRSDDSTSANDIKSLDLNLRNEFRRTADHARRIVPNCETQPLSLQRDIFVGVDALTGAFGHIADYLLEVEVWQSMNDR